MNIKASFIMEKVKARCFYPLSCPFLSLQYIESMIIEICNELKVSKSQKHFSWNSIAQKTNEILDKILP